MSSMDADWSILSLPARHWKWRARGCVLYWNETADDILKQTYDVIFTSSLVPICELKTMRPALSKTPVIVYCHENQFTYPNQIDRERDHHYGFTEMVNLRAADVVLFNSEFNRRSFQENAHAFLKRMPDHVPTGVLDDIDRKSAVVPLILDWPHRQVELSRNFHAEGPLIMWNHRWEHDKGPDSFFDAMLDLQTQGRRFRLSLCGQKFRHVPECFRSASKRLQAHIVDQAPLASRAEYLQRLRETDVVVSTAEHEFFGISVLEATLSGAYPLVPNRLVYPELYPSEFLYEDQAMLVRRLGELCDLYDAEQSLRADRRHYFGDYLNSAAVKFRDVILRIAGCTTHI